MSQKTSKPLLPVLIGYTAAILLIGGVGYWAVKTEIAGAVVTSGSIKVESQSQVVQHPEGGVVREILARDGDVVSAGDVLVRLDGTFLQSELALIEGQLAEIFARTTRFRAERDNRTEMASGVPPILTSLSETVIKNQLAGQANLFEARFVSLKREEEQLNKQQWQFRKQIEGLTAQVTAVQRQLELFADELANVESLFSQRLVQVTRLLALQRAQAELQGQLGGYKAQIAATQAKISETEIQTLRLTDSRREQAITQLRDLAVKELELMERRAALKEQLGRLDIVASAGGVIFGSRVFAEKSVLKPADPVLYIVPNDQPLHVAARIDPVDVDQVYATQEVALVFSAFNRRTTPEGRGNVKYVSADATVDKNTGMTFYEAIVTIDETTKDALSGLDLVPGMPVETFIKTDKRTPLSYLVQPLSVYFSRALREE